MSDKEKYVICADCGCDAIPVILVSGDVREEDWCDCPECGITGVEE